MNFCKDCRWRSGWYKCLNPTVLSDTADRLKALGKLDDLLAEIVVEGMHSASACRRTYDYGDCPGFEQRTYQPEILDTPPTLWQRIKAVFS